MPEIPEIKSALFMHCERFYNLLDAEAETETIGENQFLVYRGFLTKAFKQLNLSTSYYTKLKRSLESNGCIQTLQAGARDIPSCVVLLAPPGEVEWADAGFKSPLTGKKDAAKLRTELEQIKKTLGGIDLAKAFINIESRLQRIEAQLGITDTGT